jgi:hypothetical protein
MTQTRFAKPHTIRGEASARLMEDIDANFDALFRALASAGIGGGTAGARGPTGPTGPTGPQGPQGIPGPVEDPLMEDHGGTGRSTFDEGDLLVGAAAGDLDILPHGDEDQVLTTKSGNLSWEDPAAGAGPHEILSATHTDSEPAASGGGVLYREVSTLLWKRLPAGDEGQVLAQGAADPEWSDPAGGVEVDPIFALTKRYGFVDRDETTIALAAVGDGTYEFTLGSVGATWRYFRNGVLCTITGSKTVLLAGTNPPTNGVHYIYIDSEDGALVDGAAWTLLDTKVPVAGIMWNGSMTPTYWMSDERHTCLIDRRMHYYEHTTEGSRLIAGGVLSGQTVGGTTDATNTFGISGASFADEDILHDLATLTDPNAGESAYTVFYRTAVSTWAWKLSIVPYDFTAAGYINWDNAGTQTQGDATPPKYYNSYLLITNLDGAARFVMVSGRAAFSTLAAAQAEDVGAFTFTGLGIAEFIIAYRFTWLTGSGYANTGKCRLAATPQSVKVANVAAIVGGASTDHNTLANLQGGDSTERYHLTALQNGGQWDALGAGVAVEAGSKLKIGGHTYIVQYDAGAGGAAKTIDWQNGNEQILELTADCTLTFDNPKAGARYVIRFIQDGTGEWLVTWPADVVWSGGIEADIDLAVGARTLIAFYYDGTKYIAAGANASAASQGMPEVPLSVLHGGTGRTSIADGELFAGDVDLGMSVVPAPTATGQVLTANIGISRKMEWSSSPLSRANVGVYLSSDTVANDGVELDIEFDAEQWDGFGMHENGVNPKRVTIPTGYGGVYVITAGIGWEPAGSATGTLWTRLYRNGSLCFQTTNPLSYLYNSNAVSAWVMSLEADDYLELRCYQKMGHDVAVQGGTFKTFLRLAQVA